MEYDLLLIVHFRQSMKNDGTNMSIAWSETQSKGHKKLVGTYKEDIWIGMSSPKMSQIRKPRFLMH